MKISKIFSSLMLLIVLLTMAMCTKDQLDTSLESRSKARHIYDGHTDPIKQTILGEKIINPYSYTNMVRAYENICKTNSGSIPFEVTDRHIKFMPQDYEQLKELYIESDLILFDYPLDREVLEMGDFYIDPSREESIPEFYSIVEVDKKLPTSISYEVLEEFAYVDHVPSIVVESFRLTGNFEFVNDYVFVEDFLNINESEFCDNIASIPTEDCLPGCVWTLVLSDENGNLGGYDWECKCPDDDEDDNSGGNEPNLNDCGCPVYQDERKPAGCINVEDNSANTFEGVNDVKVILKDWKYGKAYETQTNADGCWRYNRRFSGNMWMWVQFKNDDSYERCYRTNWKVWELLRPVKDYVDKISGPRFNDIELNYWFWGIHGTESQAQRYWGAATVNNEVKIYLEETPDIARPPAELDIYLQPNSTTGAAIMGTFWPNAVVSALIPDLSIGINRISRESQDRLSYHEIAHASHFSQVGFGWWWQLILQEIANSIVVDGVQFSFDGDPWGQGDEPNAGHVALAESWADNVFTDILNINQEEGIFENGYIPRGIYEDLVDDTPNEIIRLGIFDQVSNFNRAQMFEALNSEVTTVDEFQSALLSTLPAGNSTQNYNALFEAYTP